MAPDMPRARKGAPFFLPQALRLQVCMGRRLSSFLLIAALACASLPAAAAPSTSARKAAPAARQPAAPPPRDGQAESRLIEAYRLVGQGRRAAQGGAPGLPAFRVQRLARQAHRDGDILQRVGGDHLRHADG